MKTPIKLKRSVCSRTISEKILREQFHHRRDMAVRYHKRNRHSSVPTIREEFTAYIRSRELPECVGKQARGTICPRRKVREREIVRSTCDERIG